MHKIDIKHFYIVDHPLVKAVVSIIMDDDIAIHDIKLLQPAPGKLMVAMPNKPDKHGVYRDMVHPITKATRRQIEDILLVEYKTRTMEE